MGIFSSIKKAVKSTITSNHNTTSAATATPTTQPKTPNDPEQHRPYNHPSVTTSFASLATYTDRTPPSTASRPQQNPTPTTSDTEMEQFVAHSTSTVEDDWQMLHTSDQAATIHKNPAPVDPPASAQPQVYSTIHSSTTSRRMVSMVGLEQAERIREVDAVRRHRESEAKRLGRSMRDFVRKQ